jgi:A/G-specific adenine glycosylase
MMELGATVCVRQNPRCGECPVRRYCAAAQQGNPEQYPRLEPKKIEQLAVTRIWARRQDGLLLHRTANDARRFAAMHELPTAGQAGIDERSLRPEELLARKRRAITRYQITESIYRADPPRGRLPPDLVWVDFSQLDVVPVSGPHRRWIIELLARNSLPSPHEPSRNA